MHVRIGADREAIRTHQS